jgi:hypothetical protein
MLRGPVLFGLAAIAMVGGCTQPTHNPATLAAIKSEAETLMQARAQGSVPEADWTPAIAGLKPKFVTVYPEGVDIVTKPYFDGGYGYFVLRDGQHLPDPRERYSTLNHGVYWYRPY